MSKHEHEIRTRVTGIMNSPNAVDVRHAEDITKALDALLSEHRAELKALKEKHTERMARVAKALDAAGAPTLGDSSETLDVDERVTALKEQRTSPHDSAALAAAKALVTHWKTKAETARAEALGEAAGVCDAAQRVAEEKKQVVGVGQAAWWSIAIEQKETAQRIRALIAKPAPATIPVERVQKVLVALRDHPTSHDRSTASEAARRLGVDLDAKGDERDMRCPHQLDSPSVCAVCTDPDGEVP